MPYIDKLYIDADDINDYQVFCCADNDLLYNIKNSDLNNSELYNFSFKELEQRVKKLEEEIRSVSNAMAEKPKQKWLWEIFEPN